VSRPSSAYDTGMALLKPIVLVRIRHTPVHDQAREWIAMLVKFLSVWLFGRIEPHVMSLLNRENHDLGELLIDSSVHPLEDRLNLRILEFHDLFELRLADTVSIHND
jgi:hypothetical protein